VKDRMINLNKLLPFGLTRSERGKENVKSITSNKEE
jgi:hypothetical protein